MHERCTKCLPALCVILSATQMHERCTKSLPALCVIPSATQMHERCTKCLPALCVILSVTQMHGRCTKSLSLHSVSFPVRHRCMGDAPSVSLLCVALGMTQSRETLGASPVSH